CRWHDPRGVDGAGEDEAVVFFQGFFAAQPSPRAGSTGAVAEGSGEHHVARLDGQGARVEDEAADASLSSAIVGFFGSQPTEGSLGGVSVELVIAHEDPGTVGGEAGHAV